MIDAGIFREIAGYSGYAFMAMVGLSGAWRKTRASRANRAAAMGGSAANPGRSPEERVCRIEKDLASLGDRQEQLQKDASLQHSHVMQQQTAIFDLLVQQRLVLDKIFSKMAGL